MTAKETGSLSGCDTNDDTQIRIVEIISYMYDEEAVRRTTIALATALAAMLVMSTPSQ